MGLQRACGEGEVYLIVKKGGRGISEIARRGEDRYREQKAIATERESERERERERVSVRRRKGGQRRIEDTRSGGELR